MVVMATGHALNRTCNATCGQGLEIWLRTCNNPEPKYGERNCSHLGKNFALKRCSVKPCPGEEFNSKNNSSCKMKISTFYLFCYDL